MFGHLIVWRHDHVDTVQYAILICWVGAKQNDGRHIEYSLSSNKRLEELGASKQARRASLVIVYSAGSCRVSRTDNSYDP